MINTHLVISTAADLLRIPACNILYVSSDGNYSTISQIGGEARMVTCQLGQVEKLLADQLPADLSSQFVRIGKSLIVNLNYVYYINIGKQQLLLSDNRTDRYTLAASREALKALKELIEKKVNAK